MTAIWEQNPDLMRRLEVAQAGIKAPIDIVTFAAFCDSREELERHVVWYEIEVAAEMFEDGLKKELRKKFRKPRAKKAKAA